MRSFRRRHSALESIEEIIGEPAPNQGAPAGGSPADNVPPEEEVVDHVAVPQDPLMEEMGLDDTETTLLTAGEEGASSERDQETVSVVLENLANYMVTLENLIETNSGTDDTVDLIVTGAQNEAARVGEEIELPALESVLDPLYRHKIALEGLRELWHRLASYYVVSWKHGVDFWDDLLNSVTTRLNKYETRLRAAQQEFNTKKGGWGNDTHTGNLVEMWYHFTTDQGVAHNLVPEIAKDLKTLKYILNDYSGKVVNLFKKAVGTIKGMKLESLDGAVKFAQAIEKLERPGDLFDTSLLGGKPFLSVTGLEYETGSRRTPVTVDGKVFKRLAELATVKKVVESGSWKHTGSKVFYQTVYKGNKTVHPDIDFQFKTADIGKVLDSGISYVENVRAYLKTVRQFESTSQELIQVFEKVSADSLDSIRGADAKAVSAILRQVQRYLDNIQACFRSPATAEVARSIKSAKYCTYMGLRMIYQAK